MLKRLQLSSSICFLLLLLCPFIVQAGSWQAGFRTMGVWEPEQALRLDVAVWYPALRLPGRVDYGSMIFRAARNADPAAGRFPLIILMHGSAETRFTWHSLAGLLAQNGFVVVAPTFTGDNANDMRHIMSLTQLTSKERESRLFLTWLQKHSDLASSIDMSKIGVFGVGSGADAALLLARGRLDATGWSAYCDQALAMRKEMGLFDFPEAYCMPWAKSKMEAFAASIRALDADAISPKMPIAPLGVSTPSPTTMAQKVTQKVTQKVLPVQALALALPVYGMFYSKESLRDVRSPVLMVTKVKDVLFLPSLHAGAVIRALPNIPEHYVLTSEDFPLFAGEYTRFFPKSTGYTKDDDIARLSRVDYPVVEAVVEFFLETIR